MKTTTGLVCRIIKFTTGMKGCKNQTLRTDALFVHAYRNTTAIVRNSTGTVCFQGYMNFRAVTGQMLVHRVVYNLVNQVI